MDKSLLNRARNVLKRRTIRPVEIHLLAKGEAVPSPVGDAPRIVIRLDIPTNPYPIAPDTASPVASS